MLWFALRPGEVARSPGGGKIYGVWVWETNVFTADGGAHVIYRYSGDPDSPVVRAREQASHSARKERRKEEEKGWKSDLALKRPSMSL